MRPYTILIRVSIHVMHIADTYTVISGLTIRSPYIAGKQQENIQKL